MTTNRATVLVGMMAIALCGTVAKAQHLWWNLEGQKDATCLYGEITVLATHPAIYYCGANWHPGEPAGGRLVPSFLFLALLVIGGAVAGYAARRRAAVRRVPTWTGGIVPTAAMEYTATSYAKPLRLFFRSILRPSREVRIDVHPGTPFPHTITYRSEYTRFIDRHVLGPIHTGAVRAAGLVRRLQSGSVQLYVGYVVVALVILLVFAR